MILRDYQRQAIEALFVWFERSTGNPIVDAPTGSGKSAIIAGFCQRAISEFPATRILMLTHRKELIEQNALRLLSAWPEAPLGIYSAGLKQRNLSAPVLFAGIQSLNAKRDAIPHFDLCLVDECHLISPKQETMYGRVFEVLKDRNPAVKIIGFTATPYRGDWRPLHGKGRLFKGIAYKITIPELINGGYLCPLTSFGSPSALDTSKLRVRNGDYVESDMAAAFDPLEESILNEIMIRAEDRRHWLVFASSIEHSHRLQRRLSTCGVEARVVTGETPHEERDEIITRFRAGRLKCLINCNVLTTGFDAPCTDLLIWLRATRSPVLYVQAMGRGMRPAEGKADCRVLDYGGNVSRFGPVEDIAARDRGRKTSIAPMKICPSCDAYVATAMRFCPECGFAFPEPELNISPDSGQSPMRTTATDHRVQVTKVSYSRHLRDGATIPTMKVTYHCGLFQSYSEWVCLEHDGYAKSVAERWWLRRGPAPAPDNITDALAQSELLLIPESLSVRLGGKYPEIIKHYFPDHERMAA